MCQRCLPQITEVMRGHMSRPVRMFLRKRCTVYTATVKPEDQPYMAVAEVAAYLGVSRQAAWNRTRRSGFPKPIAILRIGAVWATPDIVKFAKGRRRGTSHAALKAPATREPGRDVFTLARERLAALGLPVVQRTL